MAERYLWTPWDVDDEGTNTWPTDFHAIQDRYKADPSRRSTHNVHSLKGIGRLVVIEGPPAYIADHLVVPGVVDIGETLTSVKGWVEANVHSRAKEFLTHFETVMAPLRKSNPLDRAGLLTRFLPNQVLRGKTSQSRGTFNETWTGTDGDPWPSDWTITEMDSLDVLGAGAGGDETIEIQSNEGAADGPAGGLSRGSGFTMAYNGDEATDMNVAVKTVERGTGGPVVRIENGGGFDTFYYTITRSQSGNDTRGYKVLDEVRTEEYSDGHLNNIDPRWQRLVVENDGSGDPALDYTEWTGTEPGTPSVSYTDTEVDAITGSGFGGIYERLTRNATRTYDDFEMTNNDAPSGAPRRRRNLSSLGVGR